MTNAIAEQYLKDAPRGYTTQIQSFIKFCSITDFSREQWDNYRETLEGKYELTTVKDKLTKAKCFLNWCIAEGHLRFNTKKLKIPKTLSKSLIATPEEIDKMESILNLYDFEQLRDFLLLRFMRLGMRIEEISRLNIRNIEKYQMHNGKYYTYIVSGKSELERIIMWTQDTHDHLLRYLGTRICLNQKPALFITLRGKDRITTRTIERRFNDIRIAAGIERNITPHDVRHMKAHETRNNGGDMKDVQLALGHSRIESTDNYLKLNIAEMLTSLERFA